MRAWLKVIRRDMENKAFVWLAKALQRVLHVLEGYIRRRLRKSFSKFIVHITHGVNGAFLLNIKSTCPLNELK